MIEHLVLFKFKDDVGDAHIDRAIKALLNLKACVPGIIDLSVGRNFSDRAKGFHMGLVVRLKDKIALATYAAHPEHLAVVSEIIKPFIADLIAVDYEI